MDIVAHALWGGLAVKAIPSQRQNRKAILWGAFFGVAPDLVAFTPLFVYLIWQLITGQMAWEFGPPTQVSDTSLFRYAESAYNYSHSFVIFAASFGFAWLIRKKPPLVLIPWGLHILFDIFSHTAEFFPTPFLFPISGFKVSGVAWSHPVFMITNYTLIILCFIWLRKLTPKTTTST